MKHAAALIPICIASVAQAEDRQVPIDIPAGTLGRALALLSRQAGIDIGTADPVLQQLRLSGVRGRMTPEVALDRLLRGSAAVARRRNGIWRVERRTARRRPAAGPADGTPPPSSEIVVAGSKRNTLLARYAGTISVLTADALSPAGAPQDSDAIAQRLSSVGTTHFGPGRNKLFVRGIIDSGIAGPSQATTGQYLNNTRLTYNAPDPDLKLYDIASVEVLEGPQGTLYGAGSLGGVIRVVTARPALDHLAGSVSGGFSSVAHGDPGGDLAAVLNLPLVPDHMGLRLLGYAERNGGYIDNPLIGRDDVNGITTLGGRASLRVQLGEWTVDLGGVIQTIRADDSPWTDAGDDALVRSTPTRLGYDDLYHLADLTLLHRWGDVELVSSTAWVRQRINELYDSGSDGTVFVVDQSGRTTMLVNETRLSAHDADGSGWVVGISLLDNHSLVGRIGSSPAGETSPRENADNHVREATLFGEADLPIAPGLVATLGLRLTTAQVKGDARAFIEPSTIPMFGNPEAIAGSHRETHALPSLALSWSVAQGLLLFARYQHGFRPGGYGISGTRGRAYEGDRISAVEAGSRYRAPDGSFDLELSAAWTEWHDILAEVVSLGGDPITQNIGDGKILSIETRFAWRPLPAIQLGGGVFVNRSRLTDARMTSVVVWGQALPNVARVGAQMNFDYDAPLSDRLRMSLSANLRYFGESHIGAGPVLDAAQGDYLDNRMMLRVGDAWRGISVQVSNFQDSHANRFALGTPYHIRESQATPRQPRTLRIGFETKF